MVVRLAIPHQLVGDFLHREAGFLGVAQQGSAVVGGFGVESGEQVHGGAVREVAAALVVVAHGKKQADAYDMCNKYRNRDERDNLALDAANQTGPPRVRTVMRGTKI